ncbi:helix-turn-helix domain-containing protein [Stenotrophomonas sp.]|uniref:helix-turn-helix domain-containing protein n=1 Tax=Stenotrophomonas sp. TaxID=69392 RepID=UPI002D26210D|nr:transcriptional regulator [Stenotrophomonas sp.]HYQ24245.1 transcriptional regulator [Stenotrophomonas sp.]
MNTLGQRLAAAMKDAGHPRPADLARAANSTTATVSNWLNDNVKADHVKAEQLFRIADAVKMDARELLFGPVDGAVGERGTAYMYMPSEAYLDVWETAYELVANILDRRGLDVGFRRQASLGLMANDLLREGISRSKVARVVATALP